MTSSYERFQGSEMDWKPRVLVCTSSLQSNVQGFIDCISREFGHLTRDIQFCQLPYNDVSDFSFRDRPVDAVILCHSIHNRRMAITDVTDALYDKFLPRAEHLLGKNNIGVIVHDMPSEKMDTSDKYKQQIGFLRTTQPTTFACASLVEMAGKLEPNSPELFGDTLIQIEQFLRGTSPRKAQARNSDVALPTSIKNKTVIFGFVTAACALALITIIIVVATEGNTNPNSNSTAVEVGHVGSHAPLNRSDRAVNMDGMKLTIPPDSSVERGGEERDEGEEKIIGKVEWEGERDGGEEREEGEEKIIEKMEWERERERQEGEREGEEKRIEKGESEGAEEGEGDKRRAEKTGERKRGPG
ncbi:uncharacterized protein [Diadema setosum]|uniref:uncharacterized protein n=1 Tax=Diadema setosum TaxID=31175 RepID=UPI003B3B0499